MHMIKKRNKPTRAQERLIRLFSKIEDEHIRDIIAEVVTVERDYRSSSQTNFPLKKIRDAVDRNARILSANIEEGKE